jgi:hypothetical protein
MSPVELEATSTDCLYCIKPPVWINRIKRRVDGSEVYLRTETLLPNETKQAARPNDDDLYRRKEKGGTLALMKSQCLL